MYRRSMTSNSALLRGAITPQPHSDKYANTAQCDTTTAAAKWVIMPRMADHSETPAACTRHGTVMAAHYTAVAAQPQPQKPQLPEPALPAEPPEGGGGPSALAFASALGFAFAFASAFALAFAFAAAFAPTSMSRSS